MSYSLDDIKKAAFNWKPLPGMTIAERNLYQGIGYCYECFRCGEDKDECEKLAQTYIQIYERTKGAT